MNILIIDDEKDICESLSAILCDEGFSVETAESYNPKQNLENIDIIFQDVWLKEQNGIDVLQQIKENNPSVFVVMISGHGSIDMAVQAVKKGAFDFLEKPLSIERIIQTIHTIMHYREMRKSLILSRNLARKKDPFLMEEKNISLAVEKAELFLKENFLVVLSGECGSGKSALARYLYYIQENPEIQFHIFPSAIVSNESMAELLQSEKQVQNEQLLLIENFELLNKKNQQLLYQLIKKNIKADKATLKIILATRKTLNAESLKFLDDDLYNIIQKNVIRLPSLKERPKDVEALISLFTENVSLRSGFAPIRLDSECLHLLQQHSWTGNVSELYHLMERLTFMSPIRDIKKDLLNQFLDMNIFYFQDDTNFNSLKEASDAFEKNYIYYTVQKYDGNITQAAKELQIERTHLYRKLRKLGLSGLRKKIQEG